MSFQHLYCLAAGGAPQADSFIPGSRGETLTIRRPCHTVNRTGMPFQSLQMPAAARVPQADSIVIRSRGETLTIRRPCHAANLVSMPLQGAHTLPTAHIPYPNGFICRRRGEVGAIRRPRDAAYPIHMPAQDVAQGEAWHRRAANFDEGRGLRLFLFRRCRRRRGFGFGNRLWSLRFSFAHMLCSDLVFEELKLLATKRQPSFGRAVATHSALSVRRTVAVRSEEFQLLDHNAAAQSRRGARPFIHDGRKEDWASHRMGGASALSDRVRNGKSIFAASSPGRW